MVRAFLLRRRQRCLARRVAYIELHYEILTADQGAASAEWAALLGFLGADPKARLGAETVKVHPGTCESKIENWREVRLALEGTDTALACDSQAALAAQPKPAGRGAAAQRKPPLPAPAG